MEKKNVKQIIRSLKERINKWDGKKELKDSPLREKNDTPFSCCPR